MLSWLLYFEVKIQKYDFHSRVAPQKILIKIRSPLCMKIELISHIGKDLEYEHHPHGPI